uniref:Uncharacterized protein n=1 Tax=Sphaerodactylus townsendi TaxID=933632 RepID=A0ACB8GBN0_9SAUR
MHETDLGAGPVDQGSLPGTRAMSKAATQQEGEEGEEDDDDPTEGTSSQPPERVRALEEFHVQQKELQEIPEDIHLQQEAYVVVSACTHELMGERTDVLRGLLGLRIQVLLWVAIQ